jgi:type IV secretion system protein VirD4
MFINRGSARNWGPSHQYVDPPRLKRSYPIAAILIAAPVLLLFALSARGVLNIFFGGVFGGGNILAWSLRMVLVVFAVKYGLVALVGALTRPRRLARPRYQQELLGDGDFAPHGTTSLVRAPSLATRARAAIVRLGAGAYLGASEHAGWVTADPQSAVMVLGPPRSGKTSAVMIPALMAAPGAALSTSTKTDVMSATLAARSEVGQAWLFDPSGERDAARMFGESVRRLQWSPVAAARTWDQALMTARAMAACTRAGSGTTNENHWTERAGALLAPLLYAANRADRPIGEVLRWTLRQDLAPARAILSDAEAPVAGDVLAGIQRTEERERSSIFSATAGVLAAYNADSVRDAASTPNFDPQKFVESTDTIYITAPEHRQALCAPLIVGLLEQIRHAVYKRARTEQAVWPPMLWALDEVANTAPIHDLPALISQAGGQGLQVMIGLQDLSQARTRWGDAQADGLLSLFQTKLILTGIADTRTLEAISISLGEYDRQTVSQSIGVSKPQEWFATPTQNETVTYNTHRQRVLSPGEIAKLPHGRALLLEGADWRTIRLTPWYENEPWRQIGVLAGR